MITSLYRHMIRMDDTSPCFTLGHVHKDIYNEHYSRSCSLGKLSNRFWFHIKIKVWSSRYQYSSIIIYNNNINNNTNNNNLLKVICQ